MRGDYGYVAVIRDVWRFSNHCPVTLRCYRRSFHPLLLVPLQHALTGLERRRLNAGARAGNGTAKAAGKDFCPCHRLAPSRGPSRERSEEHTSELQSQKRISYAVFCLKKTK